MDKGLLFYLAADMEGLRQDPNMKRSLLVNRNQVARHLANNTLPPPLRNPFKCGNCQSVRTHVCLSLPAHSPSL